MSPSRRLKLPFVQPIPAVRHFLVKGAGGYAKLPSDQRSMVAVKDYLSALPITPCGRIDTECPGSLFDRPAHRPSLRE